MIDIPFATVPFVPVPPGDASTDWIADWDLDRHCWVGPGGNVYDADADDGEHLPFDLNSLSDEQYEDINCVSRSNPVWDSVQGYRTRRNGDFYDGDFDDEEDDYDDEVETLPWPM